METCHEFAANMKNKRHQMPSISYNVYFDLLSKDLPAGAMDSLKSLEIG